jgi:ketosteroid isomerase-like protein
MLLYTLLTALVFSPLILGQNDPNPSDILAIQHAINLYPLAIDGKDFHKLSEVFTDDAVANYGTPLGVMNGLSQIESTLQNALLNVTTQHSLTTQSIDIISNGEANATTYVIATQFGNEGTSLEGQMIVVYARYEDQLRDTQGGWRIYNRLVLYMVCAIWVRGLALILHSVFTGSCSCNPCAHQWVEKS